MSDPLLVLYGVKNHVDRDQQQSEVLCRFVGLERTWQENQESLSLKGGLPLISVADMGGNLLFSIVAAFGGMIGKDFHCFL